MPTKESSIKHPHSKKSPPHHAPAAVVSKKEAYFAAVGRRKTAVAQVRVFKIDGKKIDMEINSKPAATYFPLAKLAQTAKEPFRTVGADGFRVTVKTNGGGLTAQAEAIRLGLSRALIAMHPEWRPALKSSGFLKRDPRMVERKKYGLRKARRAQQWRKR